MEKEVKKFLGKGWKFPIQCDNKTGRIMMSEHEEDIQEAIRIIINTRKGERVMRPGFGCDINKYVFESMDYTKLTGLELEVERAIMTWEPRVEAINVEAIPDAEDTSKIVVNIGYVVRKTNNPYNLVFPFYLNEGIGE